MKNNKTLWLTLALAATLSLGLAACADDGVGGKESTSETIETETELNVDFFDPSVPSEALSFLSNGDGTCSVSLGLCTDTHVVIPAVSPRGDRVTHIDKEAFVYSPMESITLPEGLTTIEESAFYHCGNLMSITIPASVTLIEDSAFAECGRLVEVCNLSALTMQAGSTTHGGVAENALDLYTTVDYQSKIQRFTGGYTFYVCDTAIYMIGYEGTEAKLTLPANFRGKPYAIHHSAFSGNKTLTEVIIPEGVTGIGRGAFTACDALTSVAIPETVRTIDDRAFSLCSGLTEITIPDGVTSIGYHAFGGCNHLTTVTMADSVKTLGSHAFYACSELTDITLSAGLESIGEYAFRSCAKLATITLPDSLSSIGGYAFEGCTALTAVTLPAGVTEIKTYTFSGCSLLEQVTLPAGLTAIAEKAFYHCENLLDLTFDGTMTAWHAVDKSNGWNDRVPADTVICGDGEVSLAAA